jgi:hypothetical protein
VPVRGQRLLLAAALAAALGAAAVPARAQTVELSPAQAQEVGRRALLSGNAGLARSIALALLERDAADPAARTLLAATDLAFGQPAQALANARTAHRAASDPLIRHDAARLAAEASLRLDRPTMAQLWLRRAAQAAPDPGLRATAGRIFGQVAAAKPLRTDLRFHLAPTSNVNRGASSDILVIDGVPTPFTLSGDALALSGWEAVLQASAYYRLQATPASRTDLGFRLYASTYGLSDEAKAQAPGVSGSDFAYTSAELSLRHLFATAGDAGPWSVTARAGQLWYGGDELGTFAGLDLGKTFALSPRAALTVEISREEQWRAGDGDTSISGVEATYARVVESGDRFEVGLSFSDVTSPNINQESTGAGLSLRWDRAKPVFGSVRMSASVSAGLRDYPVFFNGIFNDTGREDTTYGGSVEFVLPEAGAYGFAPTVTLRASETRSNVSRYDQESYGVIFGLRSVF